MAFPLTAVLTAAPSLISAAAGVIRVIRDRKKTQQEPKPESEKINELANLIEQQAKIIEELAINNRNMVLAVRNNRIIAIAALVTGGLAILFSIITW